ncbi:MAG TPA: hypothetical protein VFT22_10250 [Kofleriaceae bacterium]|nr:hypothetical protein [Kofleriaceae bacterium]
MLVAELDLDQELASLLSCRPDVLASVGGGHRSDAQTSERSTPRPRRATATRPPSRRAVLNRAPPRLNRDRALLALELDRELASLFGRGPASTFRRPGVWTFTAQALAGTATTDQVRDAADYRTAVTRP